jgi:hypothetical protein
MFTNVLAGALCIFVASFNGVIAKYFYVFCVYSWVTCIYPVAPLFL